MLWILADREEVWDEVKSQLLYLPMDTRRIVPDSIFRMELNHSKNVLEELLTRAGSLGKSS